MPSRLFEGLTGDAALRRAEQLLSALSGVAWEADPDTGTFLYVSDYAERILGFPAGEWHQPGFWAAHLHPDDRDTAVTARRAAMRARQDHELDYRMVGADGAVAWLRDIASITVEPGGEVRLRGLIVNVTTQKRTERALRRATEELVRAQQLAQIRSFAHDLPNGLVDGTASAPASFEEFLRQVHPDDAVHLRAHLESTFASDASDFCAEFRYLPRDGTMRHLAAVGHVVRDPDGRAMRVFGTTQDVTKQRADEAASREHVHFLESLDVVNRALHGATSLEQAMDDVLDAMLTMFDCDRAWVVRRTAAAAPEWRVAFERTRPEHPGAGPGHVFEPFAAGPLEATAAAGGPVSLTADDPVLRVLRPTYGVASRIATTVTPEGQPPYILGLHHCRRDHVWTKTEERLFQEIGRRLRDALHALLVHEALRRSESRLAEAQRLTQLGYWERDFERQLVHVSDETAAILGTTGAPRTMDLATSDGLWLQRVHADDRVAVLRAHDRALAGLEPYDVEYRLVIPPADDVRFVRSTGEITRDGAGRPVRWFGTLQDITGRRRAELAAAESHALMRAIVEGTSDAIWVKALDGRYLMVNRAFADQRDATIDEIVGTRDTVDGAPGLNDDEVSVLASGEARTFERLVHVNGAARAFLDVTFPYFDPAGTPIGLIGVSRETTDLKQLEQELRQAQKMEAIGRLAGGVAHNFNNLLTVILGYAEVIGLGMPTDDPNQEPVGQIVKSAERAAAMTRQLLTFSRTQTVTPHVVNVGAALHDLHSLLRPLIAEDIEMSVHVDDGLGAVVMDGGQFEQAITNLVVNASDAMPNGGRLRIEALNVSIDAHETSPALLQPGDYVEVRVWDSGHGMDHATRARIFEPFFTTKPTGKGTGLGLSMVYGFVTQLGGHIDVTSALGAGTLFRLLLPKSAAPAPAVAVPVAGAATPRGTETILLVEDEDAVRNVARLVLESRGYRVLEAANGVEGLEVARRHAGTIDLLLSDLVMPRMNGQQLAERLAVESPAVRVLLMSGYPDRVVPSGAATDPRFEFLSKPFQPSTLARRVRECLDRGGVPASRG
jgi:PAS domain S-box-containing protein